MIEIQDDLINSCYQFAIDVTDNSYYDYIRSKNPNISKEKAINDHFKGKLAEWYVFFYLLANDKVCSKPDMKIYSRKSFDPDLKLIGKNIDIHVKACKPSFHSVVFEKDDVEEIMKKNNQFIAIVEYTSPGEMRVLSIRDAKLHKFLPTKKYLPSKLAIYL
jgi:hypothetical protein